MATSKPDYSRIAGGSLHFAGIDQGIDFTGAGPVYALDTGTITRRADGGTGWPGTGALLVEKLTSGPATGKSVYVSEDFKAASGLAVGSTVQKGQVIGYATGSGLAPGIETGWATDQGLPVAPLPAARPAPQWTPQGADFNTFTLTGIPSSISSLPPGQTGTGTMGFGGGVMQFFTGLGTPFTNLVAGKPTNPVTNLATTAGGAFDAIGSPLGLNLPKGWLKRGAEIGAGGILLLLALGLAGFSTINKAASQPAVQSTTRVVTRTRNASAQRQYRASRTRTGGVPTNRTGTNQPFRDKSRDFGEVPY